MAAANANTTPQPTPAPVQLAASTDAAGHVQSAGSPAVALNPTAGNKMTPPYASGSLYVGDLNPDVTEALLFDTFNAVGPVASVRVCRDAATRRSLGYAYVNFINLLDAERALDTMNFSPIKNRPCRIMWSHRDPSLRKSGLGNIFVKNLAKSIDNKALFDTFSVFGNILSCKVAVNAKRESLGYGFVQFSESDSAQSAIDQVNGMSIAGEKVSVQAFKSKKERSGGSDSKKQFTNVYVKNLPLDFNKTKLDELFSKFGKITCSTLAMYTAEEWNQKLEKDEVRAKRQSELAEKKAQEAKDKTTADTPKDGTQSNNVNATANATPTTNSTKPDTPKDKATSSLASFDLKDFKGDKCKGFGFVNFQNANQAQAAVDGLNKMELIPGKPLIVCRAQKKEERERELREKFESFKAERQKKYAGVNLYVKNLAETIDEKKLQAEFAKYGNITSHKIMTDDKKKSRGFGFVCFSSPDEATKAVTEMNGRMVEGKPLYVALAQRKEVRRAQLEQQHAARQRQPNMNNGGMFSGPFLYGPPNPNQFRGQGFFPGPNQGMQPRRIPYPNQPAGQQFPAPQVVYGVPPHPNQINPMMQPLSFARGQPMGPIQYQLMPAKGVPMGRGGQPMPPNAQRQRRGGGMQGGQGRGAMRGGMQAGRGVQMGPAQPMASVKVMPTAKNVPTATDAVGVVGPDQMGNSVPPEQLTSTQLAAAPEEQRKQLLGERLFPLIQQHQPKLAGKITGMLLEMDNGELLHLLESQPALSEKINEAIAVLRESDHNEDATAAAQAADGAQPTQG